MRLVSDYSPFKKAISPYNYHGVSSNDDIPMIQLPDGLLLRVFQSLGKIDLMALRASCRRFLHILSEGIDSLNEAEKSQWYHRLFWYYRIQRRADIPRVKYSHRKAVCGVCRCWHLKTSFARSQLLLDLDQRACLGTHGQLKICAHLSYDFVALHQVIKQNAGGEIRKAIIMCRHPDHGRYLLRTQSSSKLSYFCDYSNPIIECSTSAESLILGFSSLEAEEFAAPQLCRLDIESGSSEPPHQLFFRAVLPVLKVFRPEHPTVQATISAINELAGLIICPHQSFGDSVVQTVLHSLLEDLLLPHPRGSGHECATKDCNASIGFGRLFNFDQGEMWESITLFLYRPIASLCLPSDRKWLVQLHQSA